MWVIIVLALLEYNNLELSPSNKTSAPIELTKFQKDSAGMLDNPRCPVPYIFHIDNYIVPTTNQSPQFVPCRAIKQLLS